MPELHLLRSQYGESMANLPKTSQTMYCDDRVPWDSSGPQTRPDANDNSYGCDNQRMLQVTWRKRIEKTTHGTSTLIGQSIKKRAMM